MVELISKTQKQFFSIACLVCKEVIVRESATRKECYSEAFSADHCNGSVNWNPEGQGLYNILLDI